MKKSLKKIETELPTKEAGKLQERNECVIKNNGHEKVLFA